MRYRGILDIRIWIYVYLFHRQKKQAVSLVSILFWRNTMKNHIRPIRRRKFLKAGIGVSLLAVFPLKNLFPFAAFDPSQGHELNNCRSKHFQERIHEICLKYGGEFAGVKPERRRNSHGSV